MYRAQEKERESIKLEVNELEGSSRLKLFENLVGE